MFCSTFILKYGRVICLFQWCHTYLVLQIFSHCDSIHTILDSDVFVRVIHRLIGIEPTFIWDLEFIYVVNSGHKGREGGAVKWRGRVWLILLNPSFAHRRCNALYCLSIFWRVLFVSLMILDCPHLHRPPIHGNSFFPLNSNFSKGELGTFSDVFSFNGWSLPWS